MATFNVEQIIRDHDLISSPGILGFYNSVEVTEIVALEAGNPINIFTIAVLHEEDISTQPSQWLNEKPIKAGNHKFGIARYYIGLTEIRSQLTRVCNHQIWDLNGGLKLRLGSSLEPLPKQYIAPDGSYPFELNKLLKNNFNNGSYIIEIFDVSKNKLDFLNDNPLLLQEISEKVQQYVPIAIGALSDRLGNIIFQYPINILNLKMSFSKSNDGIAFDCYWNPTLSQIPSCTVFGVTEHDEKEGVLGLGIGQLQPGETTLDFGNSSATVRYFVIDEKNKLILNSWHGNTISTIMGKMRIGNHEPRTFTTREFGPSEIQISSSVPGFSVGDDSSRRYIAAIQARLYEAERTKLRNELAFVQYFKTDRTKALRDIRTIINRFGEDGVCLWDPYLVAEDIKETLFYFSVGGTPLRAIGSYNGDKNAAVFNATDYGDFVAKNRAKLSPNPPDNHLQINLEFRVQHSNHGWSFHDRFLIFPSDKGRVKAWSLGTSVNSLGKTHHILQEVSNPRHVLDAFNSLWEELDCNDCIIWKG